MKPRRRARITAVQVLYEVDLTAHDHQAAVHARLGEAGLSNAGEAFCQGLVYGVLSHRTGLDGIIQTIAPEWPIDQMAAIDRNILRLAAHEILFETETPAKVAINEAVELAKLFGSDSSSRFVNGVLGTLVSHRTKYLAQMPQENGDQPEPPPSS